jgi:hypothetical protein
LAEKIFDIPCVNIFIRDADNAVDIGSERGTGERLRGLLQGIDGRVRAEGVVLDDRGDDFGGCAEYGLWSGVGVAFD